MVMATASVHAETSQNTIAAWVQYTSEGVEARAVVTGACPEITVDGYTYSMAIRATPTPDHNDTVCTFKVDEGSKNITLGALKLPVPTHHPKQILIVGDTGCRVSSSHGLFQACNNTSEWPFARLAKSAAAMAPDLIIYTGDYIYREAACPEGNNGCAGTPYGDNQATWIADWLTPAKPLHQAAPFIFTRGNHETCSRAGLGWFRYLDAGFFDGQCHLNSNPWIADIGNRDVAVMDTANLNDENGNPLTDRFAAELLDIGYAMNKNSWLMTHRPFWGYGGDDDTGELTVQTDILQQAVADVGLPDQISLLISAHIHLAQLLGFESNDRPPQLVIGNGGTQLVSEVEPISEIDGVDIKTQMVLNQFGYAIINNIGNKFSKIVFFDQDGHDLESCRLSKNTISCGALGKKPESHLH
jgi:hypothetical protein